MIDRELDALVASANPLAERDLRALQLAEGEAALVEGLVHAGAAGRAGPSSDARAHVGPTRRRRWLRPRLAGAAVVLGVVAAVLAVALAGDRGAGGPGTAWAAPLVRLAESSPRLLLGDDWRVTRADETDRTTGEMTFARGDLRTELYWRPGTVADWQRDRATGAAAVVRATVLGHAAQLTQYAGPDGRGIDDFTAIWADDDGRVLEVRANVADLAAFEATLAMLRRVEVGAWLSAMPAGVVKAANRAAVVDEMLQDVPLPPGFDRTRLQAAPLTSDRYQLGAQVTGAVGCAWFDRWVEGRRSGDRAEVDAAIAAMASSRDWAILKEMQQSGAWPQVFWGYADALRGDGRFHGRPLSAEVRSGLGCGSG